MQQVAFGPFNFDISIFLDQLAAQIADAYPVAVAGGMLQRLKGNPSADN